MTQCGTGREVRVSKGHEESRQEHGFFAPSVERRIVRLLGRPWVPCSMMTPLIRAWCFKRTRRQKGAADAQCRPLLHVRPSVQPFATRAKKTSCAILTSQCICSPTPILYLCKSAIDAVHVESCRRLSFAYGCMWCTSSSGGWASHSNNRDKKERSVSTSDSARPEGRPFDGA